jgi:hypothetical protein
VSRIKFEFTDSFVTEEQNIIDYGFKDFVRDVGGLLKLFLGCSAITLFELCYHAIRKIKENIRKKSNYSKEQNIIVVKINTNHERLNRNARPYEHFFGYVRLRITKF